MRTALKPIFLLVVLLAIAAPVGAQNTFLFGEGAGEVTLPAQYVRVEDGDASLVVVSRPEGNVRLYFDLHNLDAAVRIRNPGEAMVREQAEKRNRKLQSMEGKVGFVESRPDTIREGRAYANLHWQIGFGKTVVVMSAFIPRDSREASDVKRFFAGEIEEIVKSLRRVGA